MDKVKKYSILGLIFMLTFLSAAVYARGTKEPPTNMLFAMGIAAFLCIAIGAFPQWTVYPLLPYTVDFSLTLSNISGVTPLTSSNSSMISKFLFLHGYPGTSIE